MSAMKKVAVGFIYFLCWSLIESKHVYVTTLSDGDVFYSLTWMGGTSNKAINRQAKKEEEKMMPVLFLTSYISPIRSRQLWVGIEEGSRKPIHSHCTDRLFFAGWLYIIYYHHLRRRRRHRFCNLAFIMALGESFLFILNTSHSGIHTHLIRAVKSKEIGEKSLLVEWDVRGRGNLVCKCHHFGGRNICFMLGKILT